MANNPQPKLFAVVVETAALRDVTLEGVPQAYVPVTVVLESSPIYTA